MLNLNPNHARQADVISSAIKESGKYVGIITRAEALLSSNKTPGLGISFKSDNGETADYLDLYLGETDGKPWTGTNTANAILACLGLRQAEKGQIVFEKWNKESKQREKTTAEGYPALMGKRIGFLLQKELSEYQQQTKEKLAIYGVFQVGTELTASEILDRKTVPEKLPKMVQALMAHPVRDTRKGASVHHASATPAQNNGGAFADFDDDLPF